jgi:breast cancer 2 susceptibility protein
VDFFGDHALYLPLYFRSRYEREYHRAHRSAVKRIQEQDSSASLPMILCVASIQTIPAHVDNEGNTIDGGHGLELTDGWYRILAKADAPISRAVTRGRLRVGYKVALMGARVNGFKRGH